MWAASTRDSAARARHSYPAKTPTSSDARIVLAGGPIAYSGEASVRHRVPAHRLTRRYFIKRGFSQGISDAFMEGRPTSLAAKLRWWRLTAHHVARAPLIFAKNLVLRRGMLTTLTWCALCAGRFRALAYSAAARLIV